MIEVEVEVDPDPDPDQDPSRTPSRTSSKPRTGKRTKPAPEPSTTFTPEVREMGNPDTKAQGHTDHVARQIPGTQSDKLPIRDTEDDAWSSM